MLSLDTRLLSISKQSSSLCFRRFSTRRPVRLRYYLVSHTHSTPHHLWNPSSNLNHHTVLSWAIFCPQMTYTQQWTSAFIVLSGSGSILSMTSYTGYYVVTHGGFHHTLSVCISYVHLLDNHLTSPPRIFRPHLLPLPRCVQCSAAWLDLRGL